MFNHSNKVPRNYKIAANIVQKVSEEGGSFKTLLYDDKLKHFRTDVLYALVNETIKHAVDIEKLFESTGILVNEPRLNPWLAKVLATELLYGKKKLPGQSKPELTMLSYNEKFKKLMPEVQDDEKTKVRRPRYVRINTNLLTTSDAIRAFQDEGYKFIRCTSGSYNDYLEQVKNLTEDDFTQDYHVKTIFVFSPRTKLHTHDFYIENKIILQDKATALAVHLLAPPPGSVVLDMCAAPGNKTTQLAAYMRNEGKIYAVERDAHRYKTLCQFVEATGSKCVQTLHKDSLQIKRGELDDVEYIILDPSCSGSGMDLSVHSYFEESRMASLTSLQEKFLKHAMNSFPNAKRIIYSTCSIFPEENERVVTNIVKASRAKWRVKDVKELLKGQWNNFGSGMYGSMGTRCLYAKPDSDLTIGFFLAVLERDFKDSEKQEDENNVATVHDKTEKKLKNKTIQPGDKNDTEDDDQEKQQIKKRHRDSESQNIEHVTNHKGFSEDMNNEDNVQNYLHHSYENPKSTKKKRNKVNVTSIQNKDSNNENTYSGEINEKIGQNVDIPNLKKKKRKSEVKNEGDEMIINISMDVNEESADNSKLKDKQKNDENTSLEQDLIDTSNNKKKKKQKCIEGFETTETKELLENNIEIEISKKKKKKRKERENESVTVAVKDVEYTSENNKLLENSDEMELPKKKKKKRKEDENESKDSENLPKTDISTDFDNKNTPENINQHENNDEIKILKKKKKKRKEDEDKSKDSVNLPVIDISTKVDNKNIPENQHQLENNDEIEILKKKKKKRKDRENEPKDTVNLAVIDISTEVGNKNISENRNQLENNEEIEMLKKKKNKRKDRENEPKEVVPETVIDMSMEKVNNNTSENINDSQVDNIDKKEIKKKRKRLENETLEEVKDISSDVEHEKTLKKAKKKKNAGQ